MKAKQCSQCTYVGGLYKSRPPLCKSCAMVYNATNKEKVATKPCIKAKHYVIPKVSRSRQNSLKTYRKNRDDYFKEHPICEFPDCSSQDITLHHMRGRIGAFLTDTRYFKSLCGKHHRYVEENPLEAFKLGLSVKRLNK